MLKFYKILVLLILLAGSRQLISQSTLLNPITTLIDKSKAGNKLPTIIDNAGNTRGAGFNDENIFVATRTGGNIIYYWDVAKPDDDPKTMNTSIITGGAFPLSDLTAVGKKVFASNMVNATGSLFKMYGWANKDAQPKVLLEFAAPASTRLGDAFSVVGDPATDGLLIASGHGTKSFYIWKMKGDTISDKTPNIVTLDSVMNVNFARITKVPQSDMYLASGSSMGMALLDKDFKLLEWIKPGVYFPSWAMYAQVFTYKNQRLLGYVHTKSSPVENFLYVVDITTGANIRDALKDLIATPFTDRLIHSVNLGNVTNGNASVGLSILPDALGNVWAMAYGAGNGFVLQRFGDKISSAWDYNVSAFKMYPNPSSGILNIDSEYRIKKVVVFDINGRMIDAMPSDSQQITLDVSGFQNGVYFVSLQTDGGLFSKKLIIQK